MSLVKKILNKLNGLHYSREYLSFAEGSHEQPLHAYLVTGDRVIKDITKLHLMVGYSPLVFAISSSAAEALAATFRILFSQQALQPNERISKKDARPAERRSDVALASLSLDLIKKQGADNDIIYYYEGIEGHHHFLPGFRQFINGLNNQWFNKKPGNVFLPNQLYRQVRICFEMGMACFS